MMMAMVIGLLGTIMNAQASVMCLTCTVTTTYTATAVNSSTGILAQTWNAFLAALFILAPVS
jgi:hypothetical protein